MKQYEPFIETEMINFYNLLPENLKRLFTAISTDQLDYGGEKYISKLLNCNPATIIKGKKELDNIQESKKKYSYRQRKKGGGRKKKL